MKGSCYCGFVTFEVRPPLADETVCGRRQPCPGFTSLPSYHVTLRKRSDGSQHDVYPLYGLAERA